MALVSTELLLLTTTLVVGVAPGLVALRDAANAEMSELAQAACCLNQSYSFSGMSNSASFTGGAAAVDTMVNVQGNGNRIFGVPAEPEIIGD